MTPFGGNGATFSLNTDRAADNTADIGRGTSAWGLESRSPVRVHRGGRQGGSSRRERWPILRGAGSAEGVRLGPSVAASSA